MKYALLGCMITTLLMMNLKKEYCIAVAMILKYQDLGFRETYFFFSENRLPLLTIREFV